MRVTFGDHYSHDDVLETRQHKYTGVLHVRQIFFSNLGWIEWNIPGNKSKTPGSQFYPLNPVMLPLLEELHTAHHSCDIVTKRAASWPMMIMQVWRKMLPITGRASRLAGGLQVCSSGLGPPLPIRMASNVIRQMSKNRNCRSPKFEPNYTQSEGWIIYAVTIFNFQKLQINSILRIKQIVKGIKYSLNIIHCEK